MKYLLKITDKYPKIKTIIVNFLVWIKWGSK